MMKKIPIFITLIAFAFLSFAKATIDNENKPLDPSFEQKHKQKKILNPKKEKNVQGEKSDLRYLFSASFIYWQALTYDTYYAITRDYTTNGDRMPMQDHKLFADFDYDYHPGFKVGFGLFSFHDLWDIYLEYTRYYMSEKDSYVNNDPLIDLLTSWDPNDSLDNLEEIPFAQWKLMMNILDFALGRPYNIGTKLTLKPFIGTKAYWNYQRLNTFINDRYRRHYFNKSNAWGIGSRAGIQTKWLLGKGWRVFSDYAFSLNYQHYNMQRYAYKAVDINDPDEVGKAYVNQRDSRGCVIPIAEMILGFGWENYFDNDKYHIDIFAGYEFQVWWNQNVLMAYMKSDVLHSVVAISPPTQSPFNPTTLMLHGLTVTMKFDF